jgi:hypothetical protein
MTQDVFCICSYRKFELFQVNLNVSVLFIFDV